MNGPALHRRVLARGHFCFLKRLSNRTRRPGANKSFRAEHLRSLPLFRSVVRIKLYQASTVPNANVFAICAARRELVVGRPKPGN